MAKNLEISYLLDFYGEMLTEKQRDMMEQYYNDDLSLSEIADGENISRQGVRHIIKKGEEQLEFFELKLGLAAHYDELKLIANRLETLRENVKMPKESEELISEAISTILNKGI